MKRSLAACLVVLTIAVCAFADGDHQHAYDPNEKLGDVNFPTSCSAAVQKSFQRGVALLHSFWYEEAEKQFKQVEEQDPQCAMAYWGEAMTLYHELWDQADQVRLKRGHGLMTKAQSLAPETQRERDYIDALSAFYAPTDAYDKRLAAYTSGMEKVYKAYPQDREAAAFYALALLSSQPPHDTTQENRKKAIAILNTLFQQDLNHPGIAHYLIHACDNPQFASEGLAAARRYAAIAPASPHAVHMPSHIFARLGLWQEDIKSNLASVAATQKATAMHMGGEAHKLHAMDFLVYAYLQTGQEAKAKQIIDSLATMKEMDMGDGMHGYLEMARAGFPATYDLELRHWDDALALQADPKAEPHIQAITYWTHAIAAGHLHNAKAAHEAIEQFDAALEATRQGPKAYIAEYMKSDRDEMLAWEYYAEGKNDEAFRLMGTLADQQDVKGKGETDLPEREMLADMLLETNHPQQALAEYEKSLKTDPNRFNGLYGAARAAEAVNARNKADTFYAQLLKNCDNGAHSDRPELAAAKKLVAQK